MGAVILQRLWRWFLDPEPFPDPRLDNAGVQERVRRGQALLKDAAKPAVHLEPLFGTPVPSEAVSSIGGRPSLPAGEGWPVDPKGRPMVFLAQLRFEEMPALPNYPAKGLLSFFVGAGALHGIGWRDKTPSAFSVRYFEDARALERAERPQKRVASDMFGKRLRTEGAPLRAHRTELLPFIGDPEFERIVEELGAPVPDPEATDPSTADELKECVEEQLMEKAESDGSIAIYFGGYPRFCQTEIRSPDDCPAMTEVLLQMGYLWKGGRAWEVCWGDAGEATFLASKDDLADRRFDRVLYNWDSH